MKEGALGGPVPRAVLSTLHGFCPSDTWSCNLSSALCVERGTILQKETWMGVGQEGEGDNAATYFSCAA